MEERIIDDPRKIKIKTNSVGGIVDATDGLSEGAETTEELEFEIPEFEELDEELIGLTPSQLQKELDRRKKAEEEALAERDRLLSEAEKLFQNGSYAKAEPFFAQALLYDPECTRATEGVWLCRTENFRELEPLYEPKNASEIAEDDTAKAFVRKHVGKLLTADREAYLEELKPLEKSVSGAQAERRGAFRGNRNYYLARFTACALAFVLMVIGAIISAAYIVRSKSITPIILTGVFGVLAVVVLIVVLVYSRKLLVAQRLVSDNEKLSSTEDGARLAYLKNRLDSLALILDDEE